MGALLCCGDLGVSTSIEVCQGCSYENVCKADDKMVRLRGRLQKVCCRTSLFATFACDEMLKHHRPKKLKVLSINTTVKNFGQGGYRFASRDLWHVHFRTRTVNNLISLSDSHITWSLLVVGVSSVE